MSALGPLNDFLSYSNADSWSCDFSISLFLGTSGIKFKRHAIGTSESLGRNTEKFKAIEFFKWFLEKAHIIQIYETFNDKFPRQNTHFRIIRETESES